MAGRIKGSRKCDECGKIHLPAPEYCASRKALPVGCPKCGTADSIVATIDTRMKSRTRAKLRCRQCGAEVYWEESVKLADSQLVLEGVVTIV